MALGLEEAYFDPFYRRPLFQLSLLHYRPPKSLRQEDIEIGAGEHRDTGAFTLLMQDDTGGLEVARKDGEWVAAPPIPGAYVINIGDMMMRWTNGRFVSTPHRVVNRALKPRYSIPFFANPDYDVTIAPIEALLAPGETPRYEPLQNGPYMVEFYNKGMAYRAAKRASAAAPAPFAAPCVAVLPFAHPDRGWFVDEADMRGGDPPAVGGADPGLHLAPDLARASSRGGTGSRRWRSRGRRW